MFKASIMQILIVSGLVFGKKGRKSYVDSVLTFKYDFHKWSFRSLNLPPDRAQLIDKQHCDSHNLTVASIFITDRAYGAINFSESNETLNWNFVCHVNILLLSGFHTDIRVYAIQSDA